MLEVASSIRILCSSSVWIISYFRLKSLCSAANIRVWLIENFPGKSPEFIGEMGLQGDVS